MFIPPVIFAVHTFRGQDLHRWKAEVDLHSQVSLNIILFYVKCISTNVVFGRFTDGLVRHLIPQSQVWSPLNIIMLLFSRYPGSVIFNTDQVHYHVFSLTQIRTRKLSSCNTIPLLLCVMYLTTLAVTQNNFKISSSRNIRWIQKSICEKVDCMHGVSWYQGCRFSKYATVCFSRYDILLTTIIPFTENSVRNSSYTIRSAAGVCY